MVDLKVSHSPYFKENSLNTKIPFSAGKATPLGSLSNSLGINFAVVAQDVEQVSLVFILENEKVQTIPLDPQFHRTGDVWHILLQIPDQLVRYGFQIQRKGSDIAPIAPIAIDPYAKALATPANWGELNLITAEQKWLKEPLSWHLPPKSFDWQGVARPSFLKKDLAIYEMHVRGFTQDPCSQVENRGKFLGVVEKIPYLKSLGINAVELLPVFEFFETEYGGYNPLNGERLYNYWGYSPVSFFAPMNRYATQADPYRAIDEFKTMVRELHRAGIEVILDVVFNHTAEGNEKGPLFSYKVLAPNAYYLRNGEGYDLNFSGCGNTFNCNHPVSVQLILDSLRYWVQEFQIDGFRFDLASIFNRGLNSEPVIDSKIVALIAQDPVLSQVKLFAEPWDAAGLYELGGFSRGSSRWSEWNDRYRDAVRRFIHGFGHQAGHFATRLSGSEDCFGGRSPTLSLNYVCCHDGFALRDLVSYQHKHNLANGEENRDGSNNNNSYNYGYEGISHDLHLEALRWRQMKNFLLALMVSQGVPLLQMGDECGQSRLGNNNTWCQDSPLSWLNWQRSEMQEQFTAFVTKIIRLRLDNPVFRKGKFLGCNDVDWHGFLPLQPNWSNDSHFVAFTLKEEGGKDVYCAFNASKNSVHVHYPQPRFKGMKWEPLINTAVNCKDNVLGKARFQSYGIWMEAHSALLLQLKKG